MQASAHPLAYTNTHTHPGTIIAALVYTSHRSTAAFHRPEAPDTMSVPRCGGVSSAALCLPLIVLRSCVCVRMCVCVSACVRVGGFLGVYMGIALSSDLLCIFRASRVRVFLIK